MKAEEFEEIITPLYLLNGKECQFLLSALRGNFERWQSAQQLAAPAVSKSVSLEGRELLIDLAQFIENKYWDNEGIEDAVDTFIRTKGN